MRRITYSIRQRMRRRHKRADAQSGGALHL
jgi:hypothetical protein